MVTHRAFMESTGRSRHRRSTNPVRENRAAPDLQLTPADLALLDDEVALPRMNEPPAVQ